MEKLLVKVLSGKPVERAPFWFFRQAGRYLPEYRELRKDAKNFLEFCYTPKRAVEVTLQPIHRFDMDAAILFSDILVIPDALGMKVTFEQGEGPKLDPIISESDLNRLTLDRLEKYLAPVYETVAELASKLPKDKTLIGFSGSPWTLACYMIEGKGSRNFEKAVAMSVHSPVLFDRLINLLTEAVILHLSCQIKAGAEVVQLFDSWAGAAPIHQFSRYVVAPTKTIVSRLKQLHPTIPVMGFPRGAGANMAMFAKETGVNAISIDQFTPLSSVSATCALQGNLDPLLLAYGNKETVVHEAQKLVQAMKGKSYIFNLGHGIIPQTPVENVEALCTWLKEQQ